MSWHLSKPLRSSAQMLRRAVILGMRLVLLGVAFGLMLAFTLPVFLPVLYEIITLNPRTFSGDLAPQRAMILFLGILGGTALILAASGIYTIRRESSSHPRPSRGIAPAILTLKWLVGRASKLTMTGTVLGLLLASKTGGMSALARSELNEGLRLDARLRTLIPEKLLRALP